jgi:hypothetical protein
LWSTFDSDTSIFANSLSKKEGIAKGYTGVAYYAPLCSFLEVGIAVGAKLCHGDHHPLHERYGEYFKQVRKNVKGRSPKIPIFWIEYAAIDSGKLMNDRPDDGNYFIISHNLRQESRDELIKTAKE